ncbi:MAG: outer membrane beta-barrel protein [Neomegalonema sp.]|nr:outer membrane beta-barrel protein [Neomegalonema sp.]
MTSTMLVKGGALLAALLASSSSVWAQSTETVPSSAAPQELILPGSQAAPEAALTADPGPGGGTIDPNAIWLEQAAVPQTGSGPGRVNPRPSVGVAPPGEQRSRIGIHGTLGSWSTEVVPYAEQTFTASDNIKLAPKGEEQEDLVSSTTLGANLVAGNQRSAIRAGYSVTYDKFLETTEDDAFRQAGYLGLSAELIRELLYLEARGAITDVLTSQEDRFSANPTAGLSDRERVYEGSISPSLHNSIGGWADTEVRYTLSGRAYEDDSEPDELTHLITAHAVTRRSLLDGPRLGTRAEYEIYRSEDPDRKRDRLTVMGGSEVPVSPVMALTGTIGFDAYDPEFNFDRDVEGVFGNVGLRYQPSARLAAAIYAGYRYGGLDYGMNVNYRLRRQVVVSASAGRSLEIDNDATASAVRVPISVVSGESGGTVVTGISQDLNNALESSAIVDNAIVSLTAAGNRTRYRGAVSAQRREFERGRGEEVIITAGSALEYDLTDRWALTGELAMQHSEEGSTGQADSDTASASLGVLYKVSEAANLFARYTYARRFSSEAEDRYTENAGALGLRVRY